MFFYMARAFFARFIALTALAIEYQQNARAHSIKQIYSFASFKYLWCVFCLYIFNGGVVFFLGQLENDHILFLAHDVLIIMPGCVRMRIILAATSYPHKYDE